MCCLFFLIVRRPPRSQRTYTRFPTTTLFRSHNRRRAPCGAVYALQDASVSVAGRQRRARSNSIRHAADTAEDQLVRRAQHGAKGALRIAVAATIDPASPCPTAALDALQFVEGARGKFKGRHGVPR